MAGYWNDRVACKARENRWTERASNKTRPCILRRPRPTERPGNSSQNFNGSNYGTTCPERSGLGPHVILGTEFNRAAKKSRRHATSEIIVQLITIKLLPLIGAAFLTGKPRPFLLDCMIETFAIISAEYVTPHLIATLHGHVPYGRSSSHFFPPADQVQVNRYMH
jgi:hypothetical protein